MYLHVSAHVLMHAYCTQVARDRAVADAQTKAEEITSLQQQVEEQLKTIAGCHSRIQDDETNRRKLHNTILELKGTQTYTRA